jgi:hypothetical protein
MNWQEIAGGVVNALRNAGVKKDVIDLQEKQIGLLAKEIETLTRKLELSETENAQLERKAAELEQQLDGLRPKQKEILPGPALAMLRAFASSGKSPSLEQVARSLGLTQVVAQYHANKLVEEGLIEQTGYSPQYGLIHILTPKGTAFVVENGLV